LPFKRAYDKSSQYKKPHTQSSEANANSYRHQTKATQYTDELSRDPRSDSGQRFPSLAAPRGIKKPDVIINESRFYQPVYVKTKLGVSRILGIANYLFKCSSFFNTW